MDQDSFIAEWGEYYGYQSSSLSIETLRNQHFTRLNEMIYLDHAGTTLPSELQLKECFNFLSSNVLANPHSGSDSSKFSTKQIEEARKLVLDWFHVDSDSYSVIFTAGSTASIKLVAECFPFNNSSKLRMTASNHTSCIGMRQLALDCGAIIEIVDDNDVNVISTISKENDNVLNSSNIGQNFFVYPAESNYSGKKYPLDWIHKYDSQDKWMVLLDASAFISTNSLNLSEYPFHFVSFSFHKLFGYPTGLGALLVRNDSASILQKKYFGGGTVEGVIVTELYQRFRKDISSRFEDGTVAFSSIATLKYGFGLLKQLGGMNSIMNHCYSLTRYLYSELSQLKHYNNNPVCNIFGNHHQNNVELQGAIIALEFKRCNGETIGYSEVEKLATLSSIHLRSGCFCNAGECQNTLSLTPDDVKKHANEGHVCWDDNDIVHGKSTGAIRISLGYMTNFKDCFGFISFVKKFFVENNCENLQVKTDLTSYAKIEEISIYPIKSCGSFNVNQWKFGSKGLLFDREWALVNTSTKRALSAKTEPNLLLISPSLDLKENILTITAPRKEKLVISIMENDIKMDSTVDFRVCGDSVTASGYNETTNSWFSDYLGYSVKLVRMGNSSARTCKVNDIQKAQKNLQEAMGDNINHKDDNNSSDDLRNSQLSFANESQLLIINKSSVEDMRKRIPDEHLNEACDISAARFRANILVSGPSAYEEDNWNELLYNNSLFKCLGPCVRCKMICYSPINGELNRKGEPLSTLSTYRRFKGRVLFGRHVSSNLSEDDSIVINTGDTIHINGN